MLSEATTPDGRAFARACAEGRIPRTERTAMDPLERPPPGTGPSSVPAVSKLQTGSQAAGQSIDWRLPSGTSVLEHAGGGGGGGGPVDRWAVTERHIGAGDASAQSLYRFRTRHRGVSCGL